MTTTPRSTPRRPNRFISDPVESPFPYNSPLRSPPQHSKTDLFSSAQLREITTIFQLFNPTLSGYIDVETFEVMMLSLGFRVTRKDIEEMVLDIIQSSGGIISEQDTTILLSSGDIIDLSMATQILASKGYATQQRNVKEEAKIYFRLFDVNHKGYITSEDLKRVQHEAVQLEQEIFTGATLPNSNDLGINGSVTDDFVQAILDKFDKNSTGTIDFEEFRRIVNPILS